MTIHRPSLSDGGSIPAMGIRIAQTIGFEAEKCDSNSVSFRLGEVAVSLLTLRQFPAGHEGGAAAIVMQNQRLSLIKYIRDCEYTNSMSCSLQMTGGLSDTGRPSTI